MCIYQYHIYLYIYTEYDGLVSNIFHFHPGKCNDVFLNHELALYLEGSEGTTSEGESNYVQHEAFRCSVICHWKKRKTWLQLQDILYFASPQESGWYTRFSMSEDLQKTRRLEWVAGLLSGCTLKFPRLSIAFGCFGVVETGLRLLRGILARPMPVPRPAPAVLLLRLAEIEWAHEVHAA